MRLLIVVVCYKSVDLTIDCLRSLSDQVPAIPGAKVALCENGTGGSAVRQFRDVIEREGWQDWIWLKPIYPNRGFSGGNNAVLEEALGWDEVPEYFMLLNNDTIVRPGAVAEILRAADEHQEAGILSPRLEWPDGTAQISCFRFQSPLSELISGAQSGPVTRVLGQYNVPMAVSHEPMQPDWTSFACALIRRDVLQKIGVLDPGFFLYFDDPDFCRRARRAGWPVLHWPDARVVHLRGQSNPVKSLSAAKERRPGYYYASRARYLAKYYGRTGLWLSNVLWMAGRGVSWVREVFGRKQDHICKSEWRDIWTGAVRPLEAPHLREREPQSNRDQRKSGHGATA